MKVLLSAVLLSSLLQLCSAAAALEPLTCSEFNNHKASILAVQHINKHHHHGYKFSMDELSGAVLEKVADGCHVQLQLLLKETTCPTVDPRDFQECDLRVMGERAVVANCSVLITVKDNNATVTRYDCETRQEMTDSEMMMICPDCPKLIPLNDPKGLKSIYEALTEFNKNSSNEHVYVLQEVGRIQIGYISSTGMNYFSEFLLVETLCPRLSRIVHGACKPLCPDRARHAFCHSSYSQTEGLHLPLQCEFYPAKNTTVLGPGEQEPICVPPRPIGPIGLPPHAHGRPPHAHGRPPHAHGRPPPQGKQQHQLPFPPPPPSHCMGALADADPAIHPICPWPFRALLHPRGG